MLPSLGRVYSATRLVARRNAILQTGTDFRDARTHCLCGAWNCSETYPLRDTMKNRVFKQQIVFYVVQSPKGRLEVTLMQRRKLLSILPVFALPGALKSAAAASPRSQLTCAAPYDVTVISLLVINGRVKSGQTLATLSSVQLDRYRARLVAYQEMLSIEAKPFGDGRVDAHLKLVQDEATAAQAAFDIAQSDAISVKEQLEQHIVGAQDYAAVAIELEDRRAELATIQNEVVQLPKNIQDAKDRLASARQQIEAEQKSLDALAKMLTLMAPSDGLFVATVGVGGFVKRGDPIGVLYL